MMNLKYFSEEEFRKATPSCSLSDMDEDFMHRLDECRDFAGVPFKINSAFRSVQYEKSKGRSGKSRHAKKPCKAVDIACPSNSLRFRILASLLYAGFRRIGVGKNYIHVDDGFPDCVPIIWTYYK